MGGNPYTVDSARLKKRVRLVAVAHTPLDVVDKKTGEVTTVTPYVGKRAYRDISEFVKVYDCMVMARMSEVELKVFLWALEEIDYEGAFVFDAELCRKSVGLSRSGVFKGMKGLMDKDAVRKGESKWYVNPNIAYRGSRDDLIDI